jgi:hypothetical protein
MKRKRVKFEAFSLHGFVEGKAIASYEDLFAQLLELPAAQRTASIGGKMVAIAKLQKLKGIYMFTVYSGFQEATILIYDIQTTEEQVSGLPAGQVIARKVHGAVDPVKRTAWIEANRLGANAAQIAELIELSAIHTKGFAGLEFNLNPKPGAGFQKAIQELERIQSAKLQVSKPNPNWTDFSNNLTEVADESNAHILEIEGRASRTKSLSKSAGLMGLLKQAASAVHSPLKNAWVSGNLPGQSGLTTLNLNKYVEAATVELPLDGRGVPEQQFQETLSGLMETSTKSE